MADAIATFDKNKSEEVRVGLTRFSGRELVDVRIFAEFRDAGPDRMPTKAGISLRVEQLPDLIGALQQARSEAVRRGLLPPLEGA